MKTLLNTVLVILITSSYVFGQSNSLKGNYIVKHSALGNVDSLPKSIKQKSQIIFRITDANTFLYAVKFKEEQKDLISNNNVPESGYERDNIIALYKIPEIELSSSSFTVDTRSSEGSKTTNHSDKKGKIKALKDSIMIYNGLLSKANERLHIAKDFRYMLLLRDSLNIKIEAAKKNANKTDPISSNSSKNIESELKDIDNKIINLVLPEKYNSDDSINYSKIDAEKLIQDVKGKVDLNQMKIKEYKKELKNLGDQDIRLQLNMSDYNDLIDDYLEHISKINDKVSFYNELLFLLYSNKPFRELESTKKNLLKKHFGDDVEPYAIVSAGSALIDDLDMKYRAIQRTYFTYDSVSKEKLRAAYDQISKHYTSIDKSKYDFLFKNIHSVYDAINEDNWTVEYQTTTISDKADNILYTIELRPVKNDFTLVNNQPKKFNYLFDVRGGVRIDFSAGIFYHFGLKDDKYRFEAATDSSTFIIKEEQASSFVPALGALLNVHVRDICPNVRPTFNFGFGTDAERLDYYLGAGLLLGKSERIGLSFGAVGGRVKRISSRYKGNVLENKDGDLSFDFSKAVNRPISLVNEALVMQSTNPFRVGFYIGVMYNFTGNNEAQANKLRVQ